MSFTKDSRLSDDASDAVMIRLGGNDHQRLGLDLTSMNCGFFTAYDLIKQGIRVREGIQLVA